MKSKAFSGLICCLAALITFIGAFPLEAVSQEYTVGEVQSLIDGIIDYKLNSVGAGSVQEWIDGVLTDGAGTSSEWYVMTLSQDGNNDFSSYSSALSAYLNENDESSATSREKYALALSASGSTDAYISDILDYSIGEQGIMSYIYGLHVLNNGYGCSRFSADDVVSQLLSLQFGDGGWALFGEYGDIDVTAMTISSLAPYYNSNSAVHEAIERGVDFLSQRQQDNGGYQSFGTPNPESAAQVLTALSAVGIDAVHDDRFIKNGNNVIDGIAAYRLSDGTFSHLDGGPFNETATVQALYSFIAYKRMCEGRSPLFVFDNRREISENVQSEEPSQSDAGAASPSSETVSETQTSAVSSGVSGTASASASTTSHGSLTTFAKTTTAKNKASETTSSSEGSTIHSTSSAAYSSSEKTENKQSEPPERSNTKTKSIIVILGSAAVLSLILLALGKRSYKNFIFVIIAAGAAIAVVIFTDIRSADEYYSGSSSVKENAVGTVTLEIRCDTIAGKSESEHIPEDGTILAVTEFSIEDGDTVFDVLNDAAQTYGIHVENKGSAGSAHGMVYIAGINYIYEYDFGDLSGWVYHVNGITPSRGCGEYVLSDGDEIQWLYTCELGHDLNEVYEE